MAKTYEEKLATARAWKARNKKRCRQKRREHYAKNKEHEKALHLKWLTENAEYIKKAKPIHDKKYREFNSAKLKLYFKNRKSIRNKKAKERYYSDHNFRTEMILRASFLQAIRLYKGQKHTSIKVLIGCNIDKLRSHLQSKFKDGMSWENREKWHIDHIIPCSRFDLTDIEQQKICFHYSNLQPLWAKENLSKGNKI